MAADPRDRFERRGLVESVDRPSGSVNLSDGGTFPAANAGDVAGCRELLQGRPEHGRDGPSVAAATKRPERVVGMHFFNPVPVMALVELVRGLVTSEETLQTAKVFAQSVGKTVVVTKDYPGFIVNLLLIPFMLDAVRALELGVATKEDIDKAITLGLTHPMGPLTLLDFVGLDSTYYIAEAMYAEFKDARYAAPPLLKKMVLAGHLGRKSGRGFYEYGS